jgi:hypothetical protein
VFVQRCECRNVRLACVGNFAIKKFRDIIFVLEGFSYFPVPDYFFGFVGSFSLLHAFEY